MRTAVRLLALVAFVAGCELVVPPARPAVVFWERLGPFDLEVSRFETLAEMMARSDAVVIARVQTVEVGRVIQGDAAEDRLAMIEVELSVTRVIAGAAPDVVTLEFIGGVPERSQPFVDALRTVIPRENAVVFLHEKTGNGEDGLYRVSNSTGLWTATTRAALDTPLRETDPATSRLYENELVAIDELSELVALLERYAATTR